MYHPYHAFNDYYIVLVHLLIINVKCQSMQIDFLHKKLFIFGKIRSWKRGFTASLLFIYISQVNDLVNKSVWVIKWF